LRDLENKGTYRSMSNIFFYKASLMEKLEDETRRACCEGDVTVRRLFNISALEEEPPVGKNFNSAKSIILQHRALAIEINKRCKREAYQFGFCSKQLQQFSGERPFDLPFPSDFKESYFGLFNSHNLQTKTLFVVKEPDSASCVELSMRNWNDNRIDNYFDKMWYWWKYADAHHAAANPFDGRAFNKYWLAMERLRQLQYTDGGPPELRQYQERP
jgi:hypothetical protein